MIVFPLIAPRDFVENYVPSVMLDEIMAKVDKHKFDVMDKYLKSIGIKYNTISILKYAIKNLDIKTVNNVYVVEVSNILKIGDYTLKQLINLIDCGNIEVKGTGVYQEVENYINNNKGYLVNEYTL